MEKSKYRFGPVVLEMETEIPLLKSEKTEVYRVPDETKTDFMIRIIPLPEDSAIGRSKPVQVAREGNTLYVSMNRGDISNVSAGRIFSNMYAANLFPEKDAFILHASYVLRDGKALLFSAPSGTGKSTQADYWHTCRGTEVVNGDRVLVSRENGMWYANGIYVSGKSGICKNITAPIGHIILLEQDNGCAVKPLPVSQKFMRLLCECSYNMHDDMQYRKMAELILDLLGSVPVLCYGCTNDPESVDSLEKYL